MTNNEKIIGLVLEALALPFLVIVAILLNMPNKDLGTITILLIIGIFIFIPGLILVAISHLPKEEEKQKNA